MIENTIFFLLIVSIFLFTLGLFSPKTSLFWLKTNQTKAKSSLIYGLTLILFFVSFGETSNIANDLEFKNNLNDCRDIDSSSRITKSLGDATFELTTNWRTRKDEKYKGMECADTVAFQRNLKVITFTIYEFQSENTDLFDYYKSELALMKNDTSKLEILEHGTRLIDNNKSYYVITGDSIREVLLHQAFFYVYHNDKSYTIQLALSDAYDPIDELCKYMWIIESIKFK
ncbi:MAG: hypothetical protein EBR30_11735 [Cytophagia bacterium]|nr:hypothetical protein [Cytophagia bacterium]